jgi:ABC-type oligopeptide transport system substrate-binding subunit
MLKVIRLIMLALVSLQFAGCGTSTTSTSSFKLRMHGVFTLPTGATGTSSPRSHTYVFSGLVLTDSAGTEISLYDGDAKTLKIIDRGQIVYTHADMTDYNGTTISSVKVKFEPSVVVTSKTNKASTIALTSGDLSLTEAFTVTKSKEQVLTIQVAWGDTITIADDGTETVMEPSFTLKYGDSN